MHIHKIKPVHGWGEFLTEIGIIVIAVTIALSAEQLIDHIGWHHKVNAAERAILNELELDDGPQAYARLAGDGCVIASLDRVRQAVESGGDRRTVREAALAYHTDFNTWDQLALNLILSSDLDAHISHEKMTAWMKTYNMMGALDRADTRESVDAANLRAIDTAGGPLTAAERTSILQTVEALRVDEAMIVKGSTSVLVRMGRIGAVIPDVYKNRVLSEARATYGSGCVIAPDQLVRQRAGTVG